jgi:molybdopterin converting factor small subunit
MVIRFFGPFENLAEKETRITLKEPISTGAMIQMLADRYPGFARYAAKQDDVDLGAHVMLVRNGAPLKLADTIEDADSIHILLPVTGG